MSDNFVAWPVEIAAQILDLGDRRRVHPALTERALPASLVLIPRRRLSSQPNYISDLGLRPATDPHELLIPSLSDPLADRRRTSPSLIERAWLSGRLTDERAAALLDSYVCFTGDWSSARRIALLLASSPRTVNDFRLALYVGATLAATTERGSSLASQSAVIHSFMRAAALASNPVDSAFVLLRLAAWHVKRRGRAEDARVALGEIRESISRGYADKELSDSDRDMVHAETRNLEALIAVRAGDISHAYRLMVEAHRLSREKKWVCVDPDYGYRYRTQIETNLSQILWTLERREESLALLEETLRLTAGVHPMSRSETVSIASYFLYRAGCLSRAVDLIDEGIGLIAREGAPSRLRKARKIGAVILHDLGRVADATRMIETSTADPTGVFEHERRLGRPE